MLKGTQEEYIRILKEELIPAMGCTEPIALAFAGAYAKKVLGALPDHVTAWCSGNIIKNVRCVTIPNSDYLVGIEAGVTLGIVGGNPDKNMEVLEDIKPEDIEKTKKLLAQGFCEVKLLESEIPLHIRLELHKEEDVVILEIRHAHTNIVSLKKNGIELCSDSGAKEKMGEHADYSRLNLIEIKEFADTVRIELVKDILDKQISYNMKIAGEGLSGKYGIGIGQVIQEMGSKDVTAQIKAWASAGSEARMGGCDLPVIINSGSGNQGIAASVPVIVYAREYGISQEKLYRALLFSNLLTIFQKHFIGKLSAFCGAVSASCASGAAITYIAGYPLENIKMTIANTLANIPGIICDGAKISCAAKIATSLDAALLAHALSVQGKAYQANSGILKEDVQETISCVGHIGKDGMRETDSEILRVMLDMPTPNLS